MIKLHYKSIFMPSHQALILISSIEEDNGNALRICIPSEEYSFVVIGEKKYKLTSGKAEIDLSLIPNGISNVSFINGTRKITASPFFKSGSAVTRVPCDSFLVEALEEILLSLSERLASAEAKLISLEEKITPKNIFNFNTTD